MKDYTLKRRKFGGGVTLYSLCDIMNINYSSSLEVH